MPRHSKPKDNPEELRKALVQLLTDFADELEKDDLLSLIHISEPTRR